MVEPVPVARKFLAILLTTIFPEATPLIPSTCPLVGYDAIQRPIGCIRNMAPIAASSRPRDVIPSPGDHAQRMELRGVNDVAGSRSKQHSRRLAIKSPVCILSLLESPLCLFKLLQAFKAPYTPLSAAVVHVGGARSGAPPSLALATSRSSPALSAYR